MSDAIFTVVLSTNCMKLDKYGELILFDKYYPFPFDTTRSHINQHFGEAYPALKIEKIAYAKLQQGNIRPQRYYGNFPLGEVSIAVYEDGEGAHIRLVGKNKQNTMQYDPEVDFADLASDCGWSADEIKNITDRLIGAYEALYEDFGAIQRLHYLSDQNRRMAQLYKEVQARYLDTL